MSTEHNPEPPAGYRLLTDEEKKRPLPLDAMHLANAFSGVWEPSESRGNILTPFMQQQPYATRITPEHNPDNLTPEQVGEGWRLLTKEEIKQRDMHSDADLECWSTNCEIWLRGFQGTAPGLTYRRRITPDAGKAEAQTLILEETPELQSAEALREYKERTKDVHIGKYGAPAQQPAEAMPETEDSELSRLRDEIERIKKEESERFEHIREALATERAAREQAEKNYKEAQQEIADAIGKAVKEHVERCNAEHERDSLAARLAESESREEEYRKVLNYALTGGDPESDWEDICLKIQNALLAPISTTVADMRLKLETAERERDAVVKALEKEVGEKEDAEGWADKLAEAFAPFSVRGEHSNNNNPWENAIEFSGQLLHEAFRCKSCKELLSSFENDQNAETCGKCRAEIAEASEL